ncbi:unnamed protein product [Protopolystoma xenopodis]|uniref:Uncharacterized protein n=1 Tax=Protopolystoma xenopodis TaxID=117903 RepID=A0A448WJV4_9PLAT|nr:unnamed protein product [Protopolystoma xenopodis]
MEPACPQLARSFWYPPRVPLSPVAWLALVEPGLLSSSSSLCCCSSFWPYLSTPGSNDFKQASLAKTNFVILLTSINVVGQCIDALVLRLQEELLSISMHFQVARRKVECEFFPNAGHLAKPAHVWLILMK